MLVDLNFFRGRIVSGTVIYYRRENYRVIVPKYLNFMRDVRVRDQPSPLWNPEDEKKVMPVHMEGMQNVDPEFREQ